MTVLSGERLAGQESDIPRLSPGEPPAMSFAQERLWFMEHLKPGTDAYVMWETARLTGPLRVDVLAAAFQDVLARHDTLRMYFPATPDGRPQVRIAPALQVPVRIVATDETTGHDVEQWARGLVAEQMQPFDLTAAPLVRAMVVQLGPDEHLLHVAMHHIIVDGWSRSILMRDWATYYAERLGVATAPRPLPVQYQDYAAWQRQRLASADSGLEYWRETLAGVPSLELPTDRPRPAEFSTVAGASRFRFPEGLSEALHQLGRSHRTSLFMVLLTGWHALLHRITGQRDFAVGAPVAGRVRPELEDAIGLFVNMLPLRATIHDGMTFAELLKQTRERVLGGLAHQELPFERLVQDLAVERDMSRTPLFQVMFAMHNRHGAPAQWPDPLTAGRFTTGLSSTRQDLSLYVEQDRDGMRATLAYRSDLFDEPTVDRIARMLCRLLQAAVIAPATPLSDLDIMPDEDRQQVLRFAAGAPLPRQPAATVDSVIGPHVLATPTAPAIVHEGQIVTYAELDAGANQVARWLTAQGVGRGHLVGVSVPQSPPLAMILLGVLRAGAAYVPLDPEQPQARLDLMLGDARPALVISERSVDQAWPEVQRLAHEPLPQLASPDDLAYVIYTSGSTGKPKGVAVAHRQVCAYLEGVRERFAVDTGARWALMQSLSFDFAVTVFYLGLASGGAVHLVPRRVTADELAAYLSDHDIDYLKITPSHLSTLAAEAPVATLLPRRALILGGEASGLEWSAGLARHGVKVYNHYGPTEATVGITTYEVSGSDIREGNTPVGAPLPHARVYVLDDRLRSQPIGVAGQIYLGGDRLARGYLHRPALTAQRFLPDPFGPPGSRMYATGDRGRWLADGNLEFLGRTDNQIKIRGYRVELGEVEAALASLPGVGAAAAKQHGDRLIGYLQATAGTAGDDPAALRMRLAESLPDYMIPSQFVWLDRLPLQEHGKVDRGALPDPGAMTSTVTYVTPRTSLETTLAEIWQQVLGVERVGVHDDFFDLGGHSLLATQVIARFRRQAPLTRQVSVMDLFRCRTVGALAALAATAPQGPQKLLHLLNPNSSGVRSYVCVPYGGANAVVYQPLADAMPAGHQLFAVAVPGHDIGLSEHTEPLEVTASRCAEEILTGITGPLVIYGHCGPGGALAVEIARRLEAAGREVDAVYLGGIFPFARPARGVLGRIARLRRLRERVRGDRVYANWLQGMGADMGALDEAQQRFLIRAMRHDAEAAEEYFTRLLHGQAAALKAPIVCVVGQWDPGTEYHEERFKEWHFLAGRVGLVMIEEAGHYFAKFRTAELAEIVSTVDKRLEQPVDAPDPQSPWNLVAISDRDQPSRSDRQGIQPGMRRFAAVAVGQVISAIGSALTAFAVPLWTYLETGSLLRFALYSVLAQVPGVLAAPLVGAIIDRSDRRKAMIAGDVVSLVMIAAFAALYFTEALQAWQVYTFVGVLSVALTFQRLAYLSAVPQLVPKHYLGHANGLVQLAGGVTGFVVPLIAIGLIATIGLGGILVINLASFVAVITVLLLVRFPQTMPRRRRESMAAEIANGLRYTVRHPGIRAMVLFFAAFNLFLAPLLLLVSPLVLAFAPLESVATVSLAAGIGTILGGLTMTVWGGPRKRKMRGMLLLALAFAAAGIVAGSRPHLAVIAGGVLGLTCALALINGIWLTIVQTKVPQRLHARVIAMNMIIALSTMPLGQALLSPVVVPAVEPLMQSGGLLADTVGAVLGVGPGRGIGLLYVACGLAIALVVAISLRVPRLARFDIDVPDAPPDDLIGLQAWQSRRSVDPDVTTRR